jgi:hypothetical protein
MGSFAVSKIIFYTLFDGKVIFRFWRSAAAWKRLLAAADHAAALKKLFLRLVTEV